MLDSRLPTTLIVAAFISACGHTVYQEVTGVRPSVGNPGRPSVTRSLQPILEWSVSRATPTTTYDLKVIRKDDWRTVYERQALTSTRHQLEVSLDPLTYYLWSVRERRGDVVGPWATYKNYGLFIRDTFMGVEEAKGWFNFRTPAD